MKRDIILFKDDWKRFPTAIVHASTANSSFLRQAEAYQRMGINNCEFSLALLNPDLAYIDPFHPDLPSDIKKAIGAECLNNPWYYYREIARIEPKGGGGTLSHIRANRSILCFLWTTMNNFNIFIVQHRQSGKSVGVNFSSNYLTNLGGRRNEISILTKDDQLRAEQIEAIKGIRDLMPDYLNPYDKRRDGDPRERLRCELYDNTINTAVPRSSEQQARNVGRGMTSPICVIDEGPFINHISVIVRAMLGSTTNARKEARKVGEFNYNAFITTAGDRVDKNGAYMYRLFSGGLQWDERLILDAPNRQAVWDMLKAARKGPMEVISATFLYQQLGVSEEELLQIMVDNAAEGEEADRDYFCVWTNGGLSSPIPENIKRTLIKGLVDPTYTEADTENSYVIRWYISKLELSQGCPNRRLVAGLDASEGVGNDSLTLVIIDADTGEVVGVSDINEANLFHYGMYLARTIARFKHFVLIPERRSTAMGLIDSLIANLPKYGIDPFKVIYQTVTEDGWHETKEFFSKVKKDPLLRGDDFYNIAKRYFGFVTSASGRHARATLYNRVLLLATKSSNYSTRDRRLIEQLTGLVLKGGRLDHVSGGHDDLVIAYLLVFWFLTYTPNLEWYGLSGALSKIKPIEGEIVETEKPVFDKFLETQQAFYRKQAKEMIELLEKTTDNLIAMRIEARLNSISDKIREEGVNGTTLDDMVAQAKLKREEMLKDRAKAARKERPDMRNHPSLRRW
jgi:hypothetical protein